MNRRNTGCALPPDFDADYTLIIPHAQLCELIAGRVPHDVMVACWSCVRAITETPAETMTKPTRRRKQAAEAAA